MTVRQASGLLLAVVMAHVSLTRVPLACVPHSGMEAVAPEALHGEMSMAESQPGGAHEEGAPSSQSCDHSGVPSSCASMTSCASTPAETQLAAQLSVAIALHVVAGTASTPPSPTRSPDTPPPRV